MVAALAACFLAWWLPPGCRKTPGSTAAIESHPTDSNPVAMVAELHTGALRAPAGRQPLAGESILAGYGSEHSTCENDLVLMSRLVENTLLVVKGAANRPLGSNEDWARLFLGGNGAGEAFLPPSHPALNARQQLVDRWQRPLFVHAIGGGRFELRSAGPDGKLWTKDDILRRPDGTFGHGAAVDEGGSPRH